KPGDYFYEIAEVDDGLAGYEYDKSVYSIKYEVVQEGENLKCTRIFQKDGEDVTVATFEFTNVFTDPDIPDTGDRSSIDLWAILFAQSMILALGAAMKLRKRYY
ncbi:MAG: hypothetical protein IJL94_02425, partial [Erysipelotrichaceae bacterium]|nr:hypothetical protein [Erysipelotrichaceae bacterium]